MANRYWVGGTGTWDGTDTTYWSTSSGGAGGASVPTSADDVFIDANSGSGTVTVIPDDGYSQPCGSLTCTGYTGEITGDRLLVGGNVVLSAGGTYSGLRFTIINTCSFTSAGKSIASIEVGDDYYAATTATVTLADNFSCTVDRFFRGSFSLVDGTFNANNFNVSTLNVTAGISNTNPTTLNMGSGTWSITGGTGVGYWELFNTAALTINCDTSTIDFVPLSQSEFVNFTGQGFTYYTLNIGTQGTNIYIQGDNTFDTISNSVQPITLSIAYGSTQTFTNFNLSGTAGNLVTMVSPNTQYTISKSSGVVSCDYLNISQCIATGGAAWYAGIHSVAGGGNTGWIFTAPNPRYWVGGTGTWNQTSTANWSTTSGGASGASAPTTTNGVYFDANSGGGTVDVQDAGGGTFPCCASLDFSGFTGTFDSSSGVLEVFGDIALSAEAGADFHLFVANIYGTSCLFNSQDQVIQDLYAGGQSTTTGLVYSPTVSLYDNSLNCNGIFVFSQGTFNTNNNSVTAQYYLWGTPGSVESTTINMGDGYFGVSNSTSSGQGWTIRYNTLPSEVTVNAGTSVIDFYNSVSSSISLYDGAISSISSSGKTYYRLDTSGVADVTIYGNNTFDEFNVYSPPRTLTFAAGSTQTVSIFKVSGTAGNLVTLQSTSPGSQFTLYQATGLVSVDYVSLQDSAATGGAIYYAGANSTDVSNNTGWLFTAQPPLTRYWVGGTGNWNNTDVTNWSATSGGAGGVLYPPTSVDTVFIDANSGGGTITVTTSVYAASLDCTGFTGTIVPQLYSFAPITLSGNLTLGAAGTYGIQDYNLTIKFIGNATMVSNGTTNSHLNIRVWNGAVLTLGDEIKVSYLETVTQNNTASTTLNTNNYNVTVSDLEFYGYYPCTINLGSSSLTCSVFYANSDTILDAGTSTFNMAYDVFQDPYNWEFYGGGLTYYNLNFLTDADIDTGNGGVYDNNTFHAITNSVQPIDVIFRSGSTQTITGTFGVSGTAGNLVTIRSHDPGTQFTLVKASGTVNADYLSIQDSAATGGAAWYAGANSTDVSNNTGWTFTAPPSPGAQSVYIGGGITIGGSIRFS